jgi:hypothetical protein
MKRTALVLLLTGSIISATVAQEKKKIGRPDIPGTFVLDFGFNRAAHPPANFTENFWGSRTVNIYYQYPIRLGRSHFSVVPGIGFGWDRFKLSNNYTLSPNKATDGTFPLVDARTLFQSGTIKRSQIIANYFDIPIGIRFDTKPEDISRSLSLTAGVRGGILYDGGTKITYNQDGEQKVVKDKQNHGMSPYRYGIYGRLGLGGFNFFTYYNLSPLFEKNKGPELTTMEAWQIGISLNGF